MTNFTIGFTKKQEKECLIKLAKQKHVDNPEATFDWCLEDVQEDRDAGIISHDFIRYMVKHPDAIIELKY